MNESKFIQRATNQNNVWFTICNYQITNNSRFIFIIDAMHKWMHFVHCRVCRFQSSNASRRFVLRNVCIINIRMRRDACQCISHDSTSNRYQKHIHAKRMITHMQQTRMIYSNVLLHATNVDAISTNVRNAHNANYMCGIYVCVRAYA